MVHQRKLCGEHPPIALEGEIATGDIRKLDIPPFLNLADMLIEARAERSTTFRRTARRFPDIDQTAPEVERIDAALGRGSAPLKRDQRACFQPLDELVPDSSVQVEFKAVGVINHPAL